MPKSRKHWDNQGKGRMWPGQLPSGESQSFYFCDDHPTSPGFFKGMALILEERGLKLQAKKQAECPKFKCTDTSASATCCCHWILFNQPNFLAQKPQLVELVESQGHLVFFYPKFHCELNFIEQCWGAAKYKYSFVLDGGIRRNSDKSFTA